jgi:hypothetical protein
MAGRKIIHAKQKKGAFDTKCSFEVAELIAGYIRKGISIKKSAKLAGIDYTTMCRWRRIADGREPCQSEENVKLYKHFSQVISRAMAELQMACLDTLHESAQGGKVLHETVTEREDGTKTVSTKYSAPQWQAHAWILERRFPDEFGRVTRQEINHSGTVHNQNLNIDMVANIPDDQAVQLSALLSQMRIGDQTASKEAIQAEVVDE